MLHLFDFENLLKNAPIANVIIDLFGKITQVNSRTSELFNTDNDSLLGSNILDFTIHEQTNFSFLNIKEEIFKNNIWTGTFNIDKKQFFKTTAIITLFPIYDNSKNISSFFGIFEEAEKKNVSIFKKAEQEILLNQQRLKGISRILQYEHKGKQDFLDYALNEAIKLSNSTIGYIYFYSEEKKEVTLNTWSKEVMHECTVMNQQTIYQLDKTGFWGEAVRQRKSLIANDLPAANPLKKGTPEGHVRLKKFMTIPIFSENKIVAVVGVANKTEDYTEQDELQLSLLMNAVWNRVEQINGQEALQKSEENYRILAENSADVIFVLNLDLKYKYVSPSIYMLRGISSDIVVNEPVHESLTPESFQLATQIINEELQREGNPDVDPNRSRIIELEMNHENGSTLWTEVKASFLRDENQQITGIIGVTRDISERRKAQAALTASEKNFRLLVSQMNQALAVHEIILDPEENPTNYRFLYVNESFEKQTGLKSERIIGKTVLEVLPGIEKSWIETYGKVALTGISASFESFSSEIGKYFEVIAYQNKPFQFVTIFSEITERKKAEKLLKEKTEEIEIQNEEYRTINEELIIANEQAEKNKEIIYAISKKQEAILDAVPEILMEVDVNKIYTYANDGGKLFFGDNVIGKAASFYFEGEQNTYDTVNPLFEGKEDVIYVESWQRRKDGEKRLLAWWCKVLKDKNNKVTGGISTARDITESKLAEEKFQTIFNLSTIGKSLTSPEGKLLKVNQTFAKMLGYSIEELFNINFIDITYNEDINSSKEAIRSLLAKEKSTVRFEKRYIHKNGQLIWTDVSTTLMHDSNGTPLLFITNIVDISDRKNLEANLIHAKEKAEESDKLKSAFLANMSHEIRTPMNGIIGFAGLLKNKQLNPNEKDNYIDIIINSSNRLLSLINDILDISKIETGQVNVVDTKFNLNELLDKLYHFYLPLIQSKNINFLYSPCNQNLIIKTDETKLFQIINNLLNNAVKFTSQGNIELACSLQQDFMEISVSDTGIGIKKEQTENVFNRFQQSEPEIAISYGGTGLGLSIAKAYTELLKGKISLESEYGKGSTFTIHIPIQTFNEENETIVTKSKAFDQSLNNFTVLIAEDEDINFLYLETLLKTTEVKIIRAENGLQAVNVIKENTKINLIIMDIKMPVMNGIEAFKLIQPIRPDIPVIAYTAYAMVGDKEEFLQEGFSYYLSKPTNKKELFETVYGFLQ